MRFKTFSVTLRLFNTTDAPRHGETLERVWLNILLWSDQGGLGSEGRGGFCRDLMAALKGKRTRNIKPVNSEKVTVEHPKK